MQRPPPPPAGMSMKAPSCPSGIGANNLTSFDPKELRYLRQQGFPSGLIKALTSSASSFPLRLWVIDNSTTMQMRDAHRVAGSFESMDFTMVDATRWEEVLDCVAYHSQIAAHYLLPTRFTLLNQHGPNPQMFSVAERGAQTVQQEIRFAMETISKEQPVGPTPLAKHLTQIHQYLSSMAPQLRAQRKTVSLILATSGMPTDDHGNVTPSAIQSFIHALRSLEGLPVWIVFRLCTDDEAVFDFYNTMDYTQNLPYDVLDDLSGEALEVYLRNPWLTYGLPLHRFREMGLYFKVLDMLDERALTKTELHSLCGLLFGVSFPDPDRNWSLFLNALGEQLKKEARQWNPVTKKYCPWIDLNKLDMTYGQKSASLRDVFLEERTAPPVVFPFGNQIPGQVQPVQGFAPQRGTQSYPTSQIPHSTKQNYGQQQQHQAAPQAYNRQPPPPKQQPFQTPPPQQPPSHHHPQPKPPPSPSNKTTKTAEPTPNDTPSLKRNILLQWALQPPGYQHLRPIEHLLSTIQVTFPPAFGIRQHHYFQKWKPLSKDALWGKDEAVLKRAVRKLKFFLHPDKLPKDLSEEQSFLCKMLWDVTQDAWEEFKVASEQLDWVK